ncbi:MAG: aminotransferase class V-fold PLP-dependent enzyme, partial [Caulobacterales bacterium]|nr:aminotransferase class V-fold PLP-dependent enzyme [Caulobacterales bacterium]
FSGSETFREQAASLFRAHPDGVAIVPSVSYGIAAAARNLPLPPGGEVLVLAEQFPSHVYAWREAARAAGGAVRTVSRGDNRSWTDAILEALTPNVAIIATPHCHWVDGELVDVERVGAAARAQGAAFVLDLTQSLGVVDFDAARADPDFAVSACYKWLLGPYAMGALYVAPRHRAGTPLEHGWIARAGSEDFTRLTDYRDEFQPGARRFDMGERSNYAALPAANASLAFILGRTPPAIAARLRELTDDIVARLSPLGFRAAPRERRSPHYLGLAFPPEAPPDLTTRLRAHNVHVSQRGPRLRVTPYLHVTEADLDRLTDAVRAEFA